MRIELSKSASSPKISPEFIIPTILSVPLMRLSNNTLPVFTKYICVANSPSLNILEKDNELIF